MKRGMIVAGLCAGMWLCGSVWGQETVVTNLLVTETLRQAAKSTASGDLSTALGFETTASAGASHAEGAGTVASGWASHAEGGGTLAEGEHSHAEGMATEALANGSHAGGTYARVRAQDSNAFIHATGTASNGMKETQFPDAAHFDHLVTLAPALNVSNAVLSRAENDRRYLVVTNGVMGGELNMNESSIRNVEVIYGFGNFISFEEHMTSGTNIWGNWNADLLDGLDSSDFVLRAGENYMDGPLTMSGNLRVSAPFAALELAAQIPATPDSGNRPDCLYVQGDYAYGENLSCLSIYDVSDPANPTNISVLSLIGDIGGRDLQVDGNYAYGNGMGPGGLGFGFVIVDVADPLAPSVVRYTNSIGQFDPQGSLMFTTLSNEMVVFSVTNQMCWTELSRTSVPGAGCILVENGTAYVAAGNSVRVFNVSNPAAPTQIGSVNVNNPGRLMLDGTRLYGLSVAAYSSQLKILDVSVPSAPQVLLPPMSISGYNDWMDAENGYLYIAGDQVKVYDVTVPASPVLVFSSNLTGSVNIGGIVKKDNYLLTFSYFNNKFNSLRIVGEAGQGVVEADTFVGDGSGLDNISASAIAGGAGSGLDADMLDGSHGDEFVKKSGDTMAGALDVGALTNVSAMYMGSDAMIFAQDGLWVYDTDGNPSIGLSYRTLDGNWTASTNFDVNGRVAAQLLSGAHAGNGAGLTNLDLANVAGLATAEFVTNAVRKTGDTMTGDFSLAGSLILLPTLETVLNPGFQTDGDVTMHWMTESGTYFKYGATGGEGDRFHFGSDGEFKAWGNIYSLADLVADRDLAVGGQGRVQYEPEIGTNRYALWVRNFGATPGDARGLLVTTPEYSGGTGIIFHAASKAGSSMASRFIVGTDGNVGVGVNDPQNKLHVAGDVRVSGNLLMMDGQNILSPNFNTNTWGSGFDAWGPNAYLKYGFVRELLVAQNAEFQSRVKIGTSSDYAILNVGAPTNLVTPTYAARFESALGANSDKARGLLINFPNNMNEDSILFHAMSGPGPYTNSRVVIKADGHVGIGTPNPESTLHVNGNTLIQGTLRLMPTEEKVLSPGFQTDGDVTIHWMTDSGTYFKYGETASGGDRIHFGSDGSIHAWGDVWADGTISAGSYSGGTEAFPDIPWSSFSASTNTVMKTGDTMTGDLSVEGQATVGSLATTGSVLAAGIECFGPVVISAAANQTNLVVAGWAEIDYIPPQGGISMGIYTNR